MIYIKKACSRCGKIHDYNFKCGHLKPNIKYDYKEAKLRNTYEWHQKAEKIKKDSKYLCAVCLDTKKIYNYNNLEVHHITKIKEDTTRLLDDYNLICLCQDCHKLADKGLIKKDYLFKLAEDRIKGLDKI